MHQTGLVNRMFWCMSNEYPTDLYYMQKALTIKSMWLTSLLPDSNLKYYCQV